MGKNKFADLNWNFLKEKELQRLVVKMFVFLKKKQTSDYCSKILENGKRNVNCVNLKITPRVFSEIFGTNYEIKCKSF